MGPKHKKERLVDTKITVLSQQKIALHLINTVDSTQNTSCYVLLKLIRKLLIYPTYRPSLMSSLDVALHHIHGSLVADRTGEGACQRRWRLKTSPSLSP